MRKQEYLVEVTLKKRYWIEAPEDASETELGIIVDGIVNDFDDEHLMDYDYEIIDERESDNEDFEEDYFMYEDEEEDYDDYQFDIDEIMKIIEEE